MGIPQGGTGTGAGVTVKETQRYSTTVTAQDSVADEVVTLVEETRITMEAAVRDGAMIQPPPPHQDGQKIWGGGQNCWEGGRLAYK